MAVYHRNISKVDRCVIPKLAPWDPCSDSENCSQCGIDGSISSLRTLGSEDLLSTVDIYSFDGFIARRPSLIILNTVILGFIYTFPVGSPLQTTVHLGLLVLVVKEENDL